MNTILFDLDGTLLPMDVEHFVKIYFAELSNKCAKYGYEPKGLLDAVQKGTEAMRNNDGKEKNAARFWQEFSQVLGPDVLKLQPVLEKFYEEEFEHTKIGTYENPKAALLVKSLREKGYTLVLATNPVFPMTAHRTRLSWIGLTPEDFEYVTSYENSHFCKPNVSYYKEILENIGKHPQECMMIGNDVQEDSPAQKIGMQFYLVTDHLIDRKKEDLSNYTYGSFEEFCEFAEKDLLGAYEK